MLYGYVVGSGYMGYLPSAGKFILFETEEEYRRIYEEENEEEDLD